jgi:hypothetical protein
MVRRLVSRAAVETREPNSLEALLDDLERAPLELVEALREARESTNGGPTLARDLDRAELRFLQSRLVDPRLDAGLCEAVGDARRAALESELRSLAASPRDEPAVLFDLAEVRAACLADGMQGLAASALRLLTDRLATIRELGPRLREEALERYAALATEEEDLPLAHKILLLQETRGVFEALARATGDREMDRLGRRLGRAAADRILARRLERCLTRRGAVLLEVVSLSLLVVVFVLLGIEATVAMEPATLHLLATIDAGICVFFIVEFLFKLSLSPARGSWFLRNSVTDLLPAIPAALWLVVVLPVEAEATVLARTLRFLRVTWLARYVQALRPLLRFVQLLLFLVRGMDALVRRFSPLLNRNFVFFERAVLPLGQESRMEPRTLLFRALRREHVLLTDLPVETVAPLLRERAERLRTRLAAAPPIPIDAATRATISARDIPVEHAVEFLFRLRPEELGAWLPRSDIMALDRVGRVVNAPLIRSLPLVRRFRSPVRHATPEARVVDLGRRVALLLERWRERILHVADMHGIVTGPQVLDRIASTIVRFSQRPAIRLLLFGGLFTIVRLVIGDAGALGAFLGRFVATPLVVLGSICFVFLMLGKWLKALAGEAADSFKLTSEAHFLSLLELVKQREEQRDLDFLARRVFGQDTRSYAGAGFLASMIETARTGIPAEGIVVPEDLEDEMYRVALLYLHFLDGAVLHQNDIKTTEQLLANLSLENIRTAHLGYTKRDRKRLKQLSLVEGSLFRGPFVWFRFITESVAVETAKRVTDYNRHCLTLVQRRVATPEQRLAFARWLRKRRRPRSGRMERMPAPDEGLLYHTTEFNALDFLSTDAQREQHIARVFGERILRMLCRDRRTMIREIFGTRPLHELPRTQRTLNVYAFYRSRLSRGRVLVAPWYVARLMLRVASLSLAKVVQIVREILAPEQAAEMRERGRAPFAVALRKIHRMKGPTLLEAMRLRASFDPPYCGAPPGWSFQRAFEAVSDLERDMDFLLLREREREELRRLAEANRRRVEELHWLVRDLPVIAPDEAVEQRRRGERAVTIAYMTDRHDLRTLFRARQWLEQTLVRVEAHDTRLAACFGRRCLFALCRGLRPHPVDLFIDKHLRDRHVSRRGRGNLRRLWYAGDRELRATVHAWLPLPEGTDPAVRAFEIARQVYVARDDIDRELAALRAVQSLSVLDVRNYRALVFELGGYAADGEDARPALTLP